MKPTAIDLFAGLGGWTEGAEQAGVSVVWSGNHWQVAVDWHGINHPKTKPVCCDLRVVDWTRLPRTQGLLASPACQGHSPARGKERPHHDALRATAWVVVEAVEQLRPDWLAVENVTQMRDWTLYPVWKSALQTLGYSIEEHILDAADFGAPAHRERLFVVGRRGLTPFGLRFHPTGRTKTANDIIEWDAHPWGQMDKPGRSPRTLAQAAEARRRGWDRAILPYYGSCRTGKVVIHSVNEPLRTITTNDRFGLLDGDRYRMLSVNEARAAMTFPPTTRLPDNHKDAMKLLGNAVSPLIGRQVVAAIVAA